MKRDDLANRPLPAWFDDSKFGVAVCWSAAAIPAFAPIPEDGVWPPPGAWWDDPDLAARMPYAEEYLDAMAAPGSPTARYHAEHFGDLPYDAFPPMWRELHDRWDPEPLADLLSLAGARYVTLYTKLGDGYLLWPSEHPNTRKQDWQAKRDIVGGLATAVRRRGMRFGVYYCDFDWTLSDYEPPASTEALMRERRPRGDDYARLTEAHWRELVERYAPSILWTDGGYPENATTSAEDLFRWYYKRVPDGVVNDRFHELRADRHSGHSDFRTFEFKHDFSDVPGDGKWEATRPIGFSFGYNREEGESEYLPADEHIRILVDIVARGGNYLLHLGPTATGEAPWLQAQRLLAIGRWLDRNGDAIYGTRPWKRPTGRTSEGHQVRFTSSRDAVHAIVLGTPTLGAPRVPYVELDVNADAGTGVSIEGRPGLLDWSQTDSGLRIALPEPADEQPALAFRLAPAHGVDPA